MAYLRWRRLTELLSLDNPALGELFMRKRNRPIIAAPVKGGTPSTRTASTTA